MSNQKISAMGSVTNPGTFQVAVIDPNNPGVNSRTQLPGPVAGGLGIDLDTITNPGTTIINNTGTIVQPAATGTAAGVRIILTAGAGSNPKASGASFYVSGGQYGLNPGAASGGLLQIVGGNATAGSGGYAIAGNANIHGGSAFSSDGTTVAHGYGFNGTQAYINDTGTNGYGGSLNIYGGAAAEHPGSLSLSGANSTGNVAPGGGLVLDPGTGSANGILLIRHIGTIDPHVLDAKFQVSVAGVGYVGVYSKG